MNRGTLINFAETGLWKTYSFIGSAFCMMEDLRVFVSGFMDIINENQLNVFSVCRYLYFYMGKAGILFFLLKMTGVLICPFCWFLN